MLSDFASLAINFLAKYSISGRAVGSCNFCVLSPIQTSQPRLKIPDIINSDINATKKHKKNINSTKECCLLQAISFNTICYVRYDTLDQIAVVAVHILKQPCSPQLITTSTRFLSQQCKGKQAAVHRSNHMSCAWAQA